MKKILKGVELKHVPLWRIVLVAAIGFVAFVIALCLLSLALRSGISRDHKAAMEFRPAYQQNSAGMQDGGAWGKSVSDVAVRSTVPSMPIAFRNEWASGADAENYNVDTYNALIRTTRLDRLCDALASWRQYDYVIFESSEQGQHDCNFRFKVPQSDAQGIVHALEELKPVAFTSTSQTIKQQLRDDENELAVLTDELNAVRDTLLDADAQYKELMRIATQSENPDTIAQAVQNRINQIQNLSEQARAISAQIASVQANKADNQDQIRYAFFTVHVRDYNIVDTVALRDAWVTQMQRFVLQVNDILAGITLGMLGFLLRVVEIGFYLGIILILAKVGYQLIRKLWSHSA